MSDRKDDTVQITRKGPVSWLDLRSLLDVGLLAAISATSDKRTPRREVLAALDIAIGGAEYADHSALPGPVWLDYVADLGDGFDATHSIAWLIGRDHLGVGQAGEAVPQPIPPNDHTECSATDFTAAQVLPAGRITIFGGDLVYPFATQNAYEDRTIGPYHAARPWQLTAEGENDARMLFSIPGNHDWYDGLGAFVQRFCQPGRWMGAWQVQQRRSYFAIKLPHRVWVWGVDLATCDDFDAPQLEYFESRARDLGPGDLVILCVPAPAWVYRKAADSDGKQSRSWESWHKIDKIRQMVERTIVLGASPRVGAILAGDLHHYARYEAQDGSGNATQLITCGGGGAYLLGSGSLPQQVQIGKEADVAAVRKAAYPTPEQSKKLARNKTNILGSNWQLFALLGAVLLLLVWGLESAAPSSVLDAVWRLFGGQNGLGAALLAALRSHPLPLLLLGATALGFVGFAASDRDAARWKVILAGLLHFCAQMAVILVVAALLIKPLLPAVASVLTFVWVIPLALALAWVACGVVFSLYLAAAYRGLGLHGEEVFSAQGIEDWKCFLRIKVDDDGVTIYPIGLEKVCHSWSPARGRPPFPTVGPLQKMIRVARRMVAAPEAISFAKGTTHLLTPDTPLAPHLIEPPIAIRRTGG